LLRGESGTGKEVLARALHTSSGRNGDFVAINCAAVPKDLVAAELFGHTKQAFSGAQQARRGVFMAASDGTLLLDEIADCPLDVQPTLLRALQERAVRPVGAEREIALDVRVLSATCIDLEQAVADGRFRPDLYARLAQAAIDLPPLRMRRHELLDLARELTTAKAPSLSFSADAAEAMLLWHFPLNVRELQSLVTVASATLADGVIDLRRLAKIAPKIAEPLLTRLRITRERPRVAATLGTPRAQLRPLLEAHDGNVAAVAQALGKPRAQVYRWMLAMGISPDRFRTAR
jgi:DNA-binding NtrC family response regulator